MKTKKPLKVKKPKSNKRLIQTFKLWPFNDDELANLEDILDEVVMSDGDYQDKQEAVLKIRELIVESCRRILPSQADRLYFDIHPTVLLAAELFGVIAEDIVSDQRNNRLFKARRYVARVLVEEGHSYRQIAEILNREFTVIYRYLNKREKNNGTDRSTPIDD